MAQFPAFPLWTDAYLADTGHLTTIEHGAYMLLLMTMWRAGGSLPNDDKQLARYARMTTAQWARIKPTMMPFFKVVSDSITQGRLTDELGIVRRRSEKQSDSAKAKWRKEHNKRHASAYAESGGRDMPDVCQIDAPTPTPTIEEDKSSSLLSGTGPDHASGKKGRIAYSEAFEIFWSSYPKTENMGKKETFDAWKKLTAEDQQQCIQGVPGYAAYLRKNPDIQTLHACRFISKRRFEGFASAASHSTSADNTAWAKRLSYARRHQQWSARDWGPRPGLPGCMVPSSLIETGDGDGWGEMEVAA